MKPFADTAREALDDAKSRLSTLEAQAGGEAPSIQSILEPLNQLWALIDHQMNLAGLYSRVHPEPEVREVADELERNFSKLMTEIGMSRPLFEQVNGLDVSEEDEVTQRHVSHLLRDFRRNGVDKDEPTRKRIRELREELVSISQSFGRNMREDVRTLALAPEHLAGLPEDYVTTHPPGDDGKVRLSTDYPDYVPFMKYADHDPSREAFYRLFRERGYPANGPVLQRMFAARHELAKLLGYEHWASYVTEDKMVESADAAERFIDKCARVAKPRADIEYASLLELRRDSTADANEVCDWQRLYLEDKLKTRDYAFDSRAARQYFPYSKVCAGVLDTAAKMYGVSIERCDLPVWHEDVEAYAISENGARLGIAYLDMHPRADKYKHAAVFPIRSGVTGVCVPEASLVCNFPRGDELMQHSEVVTFFHEFGHLLHHVFGGNQRWVNRSGFNTEWDFVEVPSQMFEEWAWDTDVLQAFAVNDSGEPIPAELVTSMVKARDFGKGLNVRHQMFYASVSLQLHNRDPEGVDPTAEVKRLQNAISPFKYVEGTHFAHSFGHLDGYSAIYYSYMWSLVIAKDIFEVFKAQGLGDKRTASRYRETVLQPGGARDAKDMVSDFLGRAFSFDAFSSWLES